MIDAGGDIVGPSPPPQAPLCCVALKRCFIGSGSWWLCNGSGGAASSASSGTRGSVHRLYFYAMVIFLVLEVFCFGGAASLARRYGYAPQRWNGVTHALPLLLSLLGHWAFYDYRAADEDYNMQFAARRSNFEKGTARIGIALGVSMLVLGGALYLNTEYWWCDARMGHDGGDGSATANDWPPYDDQVNESQTTTTTTTGDDGSSSQQQQQTTLSQWLTTRTPTPSQTPSHTPTASMSPVAAARWRDRDESRRSTVGLVYFSSALCAVASIWCNYQFRVVYSLGAGSDL